MISKEQICHDLALEYARTEVRNVSPDEALTSFDYHEKLLILYNWCYSNLVERYESILQAFEEKKRNW